MRKTLRFHTNQDKIKCQRLKVRSHRATITCWKYAPDFEAASNRCALGVYSPIVTKCRQNLNYAHSWKKTANTREQALNFQENTLRFLSGVRCERAIDWFVDSLKTWKRLQKRENAFEFLIRWVAVHSCLKGNIIATFVNKRINSLKFSLNFYFEISKQPHSKCTGYASHCKAFWEICDVPKFTCIVEILSVSHFTFELLSSSECIRQS